MVWPVTVEVSCSGDPKFIPMGAPIFLSMARAEPNGIWIAQDTGGAVKGHNRVDTFWGAGTEARAIAGGMSARGGAWLLVPQGTYRSEERQVGEGSGSTVGYRGVPDHKKKNNKQKT